MHETLSKQIRSVSDNGFVIISKMLQCCNSSKPKRETGHKSSR